MAFERERSCLPWLGSGGILRVNNAATKPPPLGGAFCAFWDSGHFLVVIGRQAETAEETAGWLLVLGRVVLEVQNGLAVSGSHVDLFLGTSGRSTRTGAWPRSWEGSRHNESISIWHLNRLGLWRMGWDGTVQLKSMP